MREAVAASGPKTDAVALASTPPPPFAAAESPEFPGEKWRGGRRIGGMDEERLIHVVVLKFLLI